MTITDPQTLEFAYALAQARLNGNAIDAPKTPVPLSNAYEIQEHVISVIGGQPCGWKVGSTSVEAQRRLGTDEPGAGRLLQQFVYADNEPITVFTSHDIQVEAEFAFRVGKCLPPRVESYTVKEVRESIATFIPAMELVGSRFKAGLTGSGRALVTADCGANVALICGKEIELPSDLDLPSHPCSLSINDTLMAEGDGSHALGDPIRVLTWLANHLSARALGLESGAIVSTGTCTGLLPVQPNDQLRADFGSLGCVRCTLIEAVCSS